MSCGYQVLLALPDLPGGMFPVERGLGHEPC
jgi:hypothetical protein